MRREADRFAACDVATLVIAFDSPERLAAYGRHHDLPFVLLSDTGRGVYEAYGMGRGPWWRIWGPRVWKEYFDLVRHGRRPHRIEGDTLQTGGDVAIDAEGIVRGVHIGRDPTDRPPVAELLRALNCAPP